MHYLDVLIFNNNKLIIYQALFILWIDGFKRASNDKSELTQHQWLYFLRSLMEKSIIKFVLIHSKDHHRK
ncbi:unnamed protein product [Blepharisma stoltei]|uniref:Uncharacterized protein n=1 Tax=Blepharisma stoltei TaxID=1481888 RepID=A0AAU9IN65_9CILI|nr:unnamed protein product [Blepharisma stoltei]